MFSKKKKKKQEEVISAWLELKEKILSQHQFQLGRLLQMFGIISLESHLTWEWVEARIREVKEGKENHISILEQQRSERENEIKTTAKALQEQLMALRAKIKEVDLKNEIGMNILATVYSLHPDLGEEGPVIEEVD